MENKATIQLLGPITITIGGKTHILSGSIAKLIALLALQEKTAFRLFRGRIAGKIWPETTEEKARHLLSNTLYRLKNMLGDDHLIVESTAESIGLVDIETDVVRFKKLIDSAVSKNWSQAFELYHGDLAEEIDADWVLPYRAELWEKQIVGLEKACRHLWEAADYVTGHLIAKKWVLHDPINEEATYYLMRFLVRIGRETSALQQFQKLTKLLDDELGILPLPHLQKFYDDLKSERATTINQTDLRHESFVGRHAERERLIGYLSGLAQGKGGILLLEGDAGIGKTRLLEELQNSARLRQIQIAYGKGENDVASELLAPLSSALRKSYRPEWMGGDGFPSFSKMLLLPFLTAAEPIHAGVVPDNLNRSVPFDTALRHLLESLCQSGPMILCLDDLHCGEASLWPVLEMICQITTHLPLLIVLSYRPIEMGEQPIGQQTILEIERKFLPEQIRLDGLSLEEIRQVAADLQSDLSVEKIEEIFRLSRGNPFVAKEFLLNKGEPTESLNDLLLSRFLRLSKIAQQNLNAAVVLGNSFPYDVWQECSGGQIEINELINGRFIIQNDEVNGYSFYHDFVRSLLYHRMSDKERVERHLRAIHVLVRAKVSAEQIAWHCEAANQLHEAVYYHQKAAANNLLVNGIENARRHVKAAQEIGEKVDLSAEASLRLDILDLKINQISHQSASQSDQVQEMKSVAYDLEDATAIIQIGQLELKMRIAKGDHANLQTTCDKLLEETEKYGDTRELIESLLLVADANINATLKSKAGFDLIRKALPLIDSIGNNPQFLAAAKMLEANAYLRLRQTDEAANCLQLVGKLLQEHNWLEPMYTRYQYLSVVLDQVQSRTYEAFEGYKALVPVFKMLNDIEGLTGTLSNVSHTGMLLGQHEEAISAAEELVHIAKQQADVNQQRLATIHYADACVMGGYLDEAEAALVGIIPWLEEGATGRPARKGWHAYGGLRFFQERYEDSFEAYGRLINTIQDQQELTITPYLVYAESAKLIGKDNIALETLERIEEQFDTTKQKNSSDMYQFYVFWFVRQEFSYLLRARETMFWMSDHIRNEQIRRDYVERDPVYPFMQKAWHQETRPFEIELPSTTANGTKKVELTFDYGAHDDALKRELGKVGLRQERIRRLLAEAAYRQVVLNNSTIGELLGVNVRTIERDMQKIREAGLGDSRE